MQDNEQMFGDAKRDWYSHSQFDSDGEKEGLYLLCVVVYRENRWS